MTDPITYASVTGRFGLPLLHPAQAQKETFVNEALVRADAMMHCCIEGEAAAPPPQAEEGETWLVTENSTGDWAGHENHLAFLLGGGWTFIPPQDGLRVFDRSSGRFLLFFETWKKASSFQEPLGGSTVDQEARVVIGELVTALKAMGVLPSV